MNAETNAQSNNTGLVANGIAAFRGERLVLHDVSLSVEPGGALLLQGANGAGKTTLLRILAGLKRPEAGTVTWNGAPVGDGGCAYLGHLDAIKPGLTLRENLDFPPPHRNMLEALGLAPLADLPARLLSAGQKRRAALARLAGSGARLWLMDEPTLGLDTASVAALGLLLAEHRATGGAIVAATHLPLPLPHAQTMTLQPLTPVEMAGVRVQGVTDAILQ